jgi:ABC-type transport system involved in cytochrome c biogenesis permease subunit
MTTALVTWLACFLMVTLRITAGWRGRKAALMAVAVVACSAATWALHYVQH